MVDKSILDLLEDLTPAPADSLETQGAAGGAGSTKRSSYQNITRNALTPVDASNQGVMSSADKIRLDANLFTNKNDATAAPTANDDSADTSSNGIFSVGSKWVDVTNDLSYICVDSTATAAIWNILDRNYTAALGTGLLEGGVLSLNADTAKYDVAAGSGCVVDNITDPVNGVPTPVTWGTFSAQVHLAGETTYIGIDSAGAIFQQATLFTQKQLRSIIKLGVLIHGDGLATSTITSISNRPLSSFNTPLDLADLSTAVGAINVGKGNVFSAGGANLTVAKDAGVIYTIGINFRTDDENPNFATLGTVNPQPIIYDYQDGGGDFTIVAPVTNVDPDQWDEGDGSLAAVPTGAFTIQHMFLAPTGDAAFMYGQTLYPSLTAAKAELNTEIRVQDPRLDVTLHRGALILQEGTTDLTDPEKALFVDATGFKGEVLNVSSPALATLESLGDGSTVETVDTVVTSDGADISILVQQQGGGNLTCILAEDTFNFIATSINLTAGTDTVPQANYTYIVDNAGTATLTNSTSGFPTSGDYVGIAKSLVQSVGKVVTDGPLVVQPTVAHISNAEPNGHLAHINDWIRAQHATWIDGIAGTISIVTNPGSADNVTFANSTGNVLQIHDRTFPARDMAVSDHVHVQNGDGVTIVAYEEFDDLNGILTDANNVSLSASRFNFVIWGAISEDSGNSHLYLNLPLGSYSNDADAIADINKTSVYSFPADFRGTAFLIGRVTLRHQTQNNGTWTELNYEDLRGLNPNNVAGGGTAQQTSFSDGQFEITDDADNTKVAQFQASGITTATTRTYTMPDKDGTLATLADTGGGSFQYGAILEKTSAYTILSGDSGSLISCDGTFILTLPAAPTPFVTLGDFVDIVNKGTGVITITAGGPGDGINAAGNDTFDLYAGEQVRLTNASASDPVWRASPSIQEVIDGNTLATPSPSFVGSKTGDGGSTVAMTPTQAQVELNGEPIAMADALLTAPLIKDYAIESVVPADGATITLNYTVGPDFLFTLTQNMTLAFSNWPVSGTLGKISLQITQDSDSAKTVAWTNVDRWEGGTAPTMTVTLSAIDEYVFWTRDGGTTVYGAILGQAFA